MDDLQTDRGTAGKAGESQRSPNKKYIKITAIVSIFIILFLLLFVLVIKPLLEKKIIEEQISKYMEEIKTGYLSELDYDIPAEVYAYATGNLNSNLKSAIDYVAGGEESMKRGWLDIMKYMEYSIDSIEKDDAGNYIIIITFTNRNLAMILSGTVEDMNEEKGKLFLGAISGNIDEQFWKNFEMNRDATEQTVSKKCQFRIVKDENGNWSLDMENLDFEILGAMAGLEDKYMDMLNKQE